METLTKCTRCGKIWDDDGCRVGPADGVEYKIEEIICEMCSDSDNERR